jgi:hypothetical protein
LVAGRKARPAGGDEALLGRRRRTRAGAEVADGVGEVLQLITVMIARAIPRPDEQLVKVVGAGVFGPAVPTTHFEGRRRQARPRHTGAAEAP